MPLMKRPLTPETALLGDHSNIISGLCRSLAGAVRAQSVSPPSYRSDVRYGGPAVTHFPGECEWYSDHGPTPSCPN